jgi:hypothetical protein
MFVAGGFILGGFAPGVFLPGGGRGGIGAGPPAGCALSIEGMAMPMRMTADTVFMMGVFLGLG